MNRILTIISSMIACFLIIAYILPRKIRVSDVIIINDDIHDVFNNVNNLKRWEKWSTWAEEDPAARYYYSAVLTGLNATMKWESRHLLTGEGELRITAIRTPEMIRYNLHFPKFNHTEKLGFDFTKVQKGTLITWWDELDSGMNPFMRFLNFFIIEDMIHKDFKTGLENLKKLCEGKR